MTSTFFEDDFGELCLRKYNSLGKSGKPNPSEWTVLSCIIQHDEQSEKSKVVTLTTGTKCIGSDQLCPQGFILNDSHAEIIVRRAFLRYVYYQILKHNDIFQYNIKTKRFKLKKGISFHFFSTHSPCGDATIISSSITDNNLDSPMNKRMKYDNESEIFTGAKLIGSNRTDLMNQEEGSVRTKPGRGVPTLSMSCSDKIARWNVFGLQGALLDSILDEPIYLKSFTFCSNVCIKSIRRALYERWSHTKPFINNRYRINKPDIRISSIILPSELILHNKNNEMEPCPTSIIWCDIDERLRPLEIAVSGKKQGVTKKNWNKKSSSLNISKIMLFQQFKNVLQQNKDILDRLSLTECDLKTKSYKDMKQISIDYQIAWNTFKTEFIGIWTTKPENLNEFL